MSFKGKKNIYRCMEGCGWQAVTIDIDHGTTPYMIECENPNCEPSPRASSFTKKSYAASRFYRLTEEEKKLEPTHEWFRPKKKAVKTYGRGLIQHYRQGGLFLMKIGDEPNADQDQQERNLRYSFCPNSQAIQIRWDPKPGEQRRNDESNNQKESSLSKETLKG